MIKVPLIIFYPKELPQHKIIPEQVEHIDITPTLCDILRIKKLDNFEGKSLLSLMKGKNKKAFTYAFSEHQEFEQDSCLGEWLFSKFCVRTSEFKLIYTVKPDSEEYELYNLKEDPGEMNNIIDRDTERASFLKQKLVAWASREKPDMTPEIKKIDEKTKKKIICVGFDSEHHAIDGEEQKVNKQEVGQ